MSIYLPFQLPSCYICGKFSFNLHIINFNLVVYEEIFPFVNSFPAAYHNSA